MLSLVVALAIADLRVIVHGRLEDLPRDDSPKMEDLLSADALALRFGAPLFIHYVADRGELMRALQDDRGDVLVSAVPAGSSLGYGMKETLPVRASDVVVVVKKGAPRPTRQTLATVRVTGDHLDRVVKTLEPIRVERIVAIDDLDAIARVGSGELESALVLAEDVAAHRLFRDDVDVALTVGRVPLVWSVRNDEIALLKALNGYLSERALTQHKGVELGGDLEDIKRRRVLRVAMLNNSASYFVHRGEEMGFQFELADLLADKLGVRLEVVVPDKPNAIAELLRNGRADLAVSSTQNKEQSVVYSSPYMFANQVLVQKASEAPVTKLEALEGRTITVRESSAYWPVLLKARDVGHFQLAAADEALETEDLIDQVASGKLALTVANSSLFEIERQIRSGAQGDDVQATLVLAEAQPLVYAVREEAKELLLAVNAFIKAQYKGTAYNTLLNKYFRNEKRVKLWQEQAVQGGISPYDEIAKKYAAKYGLDWRFVVAQMYQESHFDPKARSWVGAVGLMQVMPKTAVSLGFPPRLPKPDDQVHAGVRYMSDILKRIDPAMDLRQRLRFSLAAYNAGLGHVLDARELAKERGLDASRWFENVERTILLLEKKEFADRARHGYCRGREVVKYVSEIQSKYDAYVVLQP